MKKIITMILTLAIAISGIVVPADKANAEVVPGTETPSVEATAAPVQTATPIQTRRINIPTKKIQRKIMANVNRYHSEFYSNGQTIPVTKGFTESLMVCGHWNKKDENVKWTSSNPKVVAIQTKPVMNHKKNCIIKGKKYGTATLTAEYKEGKTTVTVRVVKNEYSCKIKDLDETQTFDIMSGKKECTGLSGITSAKFNKKGNLVVKYYEARTKWTEFGKKNNYRSVTSTNNKVTVYVRNEKGKRIINYTKKLGNGLGKTLSFQRPKESGTVVIPKKYFKGKKIDLRRCDYVYSVFGNVGCSEALKARR